MVCAHINLKHVLCHNYITLTCEMADEARLTSVGTSASLGAPIKEVGVLAAGVSGGV